MLAGVAAFRWAALAWLTAVLVSSRRDLDRPALAVLFVIVALIFTVAAFVYLVDVRPALRGLTRR